MIAAILWGLAAMAAMGWGLAAYFGVRYLTLEEPATSTTSLRDQSATASDDGAFGHAPVGLCQLALDGRIVRANHQLQTLCGFDEEQLNAYFLPEPST